MSALVQPNDCTLLQDVLRQALSLGIQVVFLRDLSGLGVRAGLDPQVVSEVERRARVLSHSVRALKAEVRRLRPVFATYARAR